MLIKGGTMHGTTGRWLLILVAGAAALLTMPTAASAARPAFAGTCQFTGTLAYDSGVGFAPTAVRWRDWASGTCGGSPATISERLTDDIGGCGPTSDAHGRGVLEIQGIGRIRYAVDHPFVVGSPGVLYGRGGGAARLVLTAYLRGTPASAQECLGNSFTTQGFDEVIATTTTLVG